MAEDYGYPKAFTDLSQFKRVDRPELTPAEVAAELSRIASNAETRSIDVDDVIELPRGTDPGYVDSSEQITQVTGPDGEVGLQLPIRGSGHRHHG